MRGGNGSRSTVRSTVRTDRRFGGGGRGPRRRVWLPFAPPVGVFVALSAISTAALVWLLTSKAGLAALLAYLAAINATTLWVYLYDKSVAGGTLWRVPERVLHWLALAGGTPAALLAQIVLRHKTIKRSFRNTSWAILTIQVVILAAWMWYAYFRG